MDKIELLTIDLVEKRIIDRLRNFDPQKDLTIIEELGVLYRPMVPGYVAYNRILGDRDDIKIEHVHDGYRVEPKRGNYTAPREFLIKSLLILLLNELKDSIQESDYQLMSEEIKVGSYLHPYIFEGEYKDDAPAVVKVARGVIEKLFFSQES